MKLSQTPIRADGKRVVIYLDVAIDKYNIEALTTFIKTLLADLGEAYRRSSISQTKVLLDSIFPSGTAWNYNGTLNFTISTLYQYKKKINGVVDQSQKKE